MPQQFGKGLESLIPKKSEPAFSIPQESKKEAVFLIEIDRIKSNPYQPRREFDQEALESLAESISAHGILQPLVVTRFESSGGGETQYELVAGERRLLAAKMANFSRVPVIIRESNTQQKLELSLIENVQRADLNPIEKAGAFKRLQSEFGFSQKDIAKIAGKSRESVANTIRLLSLSSSMQLALREGKISEGHARAIMMVEDAAKKEQVFSKIIKDGLSVRDAELLSQKLRVWQAPRKNTVLAAELKKLEEKIKEVFGLPEVKFKIEAGRPRLVISFSSKDEVEDLLKKFKS